MKTKIRNILQIIGIFLLASCNHEEGNKEFPAGNKIVIDTEISVDGVAITDTRASTEAGYTTGDGLYDKGDKATVAAFANDGYELVKFYDKKIPSIDLGSSYTFPVENPQTFKAEFRKVDNYNIAISADPVAGGTVTGGGSHKGGASCTVSAIPKTGYVFGGWYENGIRVSSDASYTFTVSSNRTLTAKFGKTYYFWTEGYGTVSHSEVTFMPGDAPVTVTATPQHGCTFDRWEQGDGDRWDYFDPRESLIIDYDFCDDIYKSSGTIFKAIFNGTPTLPTNTVSLKSIIYTGVGLTAIVKSTYVADSDLEVDFEAKYDYSYRNGEHWEFISDVEDSNLRIALPAGKSEWTITLDFRYTESSGTGSSDSQIDNIRWSFMGNNGRDGTGIEMGDYLYYYNCENGTLR